MDRDDWTLIAECIAAGLFTFVFCMAFFWLITEASQW